MSRSSESIPNFVAIAFNFCTGNAPHHSIPASTLSPFILIPYICAISLSVSLSKDDLTYKISISRLKIKSAAQIYCIGFQIEMIISLLCYLFALFFHLPFFINIFHSLNSSTEIDMAAKMCVCLVIFRFRFAIQHKLKIGK